MDTQPETKERRSVRRPTHAQVFALGSLIDAHCIATGEGTCLYEDGWSDRRVLEESGLNLSVHTVETIRRDMKGELAPAATPEAAALAKRIEKLEWANKAMQQQIDALQERLDALVAGRTRLEWDNALQAPRMTVYSTEPANGSGGA